MSTNLVRDSNYYQEICDIQDNSLMPSFLNTCYIVFYLQPHLDSLRHGVSTLLDPQAQIANCLKALQLLMQLTVSFCNCVVYTISVPFNLIFFGIKLAIFHTVPVMEFISFLDTLVAFFAIFSGAISIAFETYGLYHIHQFRNQYHIQELCDLNQIIKNPHHPKRVQVLQKSMDLLAQFKEKNLLQKLDDSAYDTLRQRCQQEMDSIKAVEESIDLSSPSAAEELRNILLRPIYDQLRKEYGPLAPGHNRFEITSLLYETSAEHLKELLKDSWEERGGGEACPPSLTVNDRLEDGQCMELNKAAQSKASIEDSFMEMVEEINIQTKRKKYFHLVGITFSACMIAFSLFFICFGPIMWLWVIAFLSLSLISIIKHTFFRNLLLSAGAPPSISMLIPPFFSSLFSALYASAKRASSQISSKAKQWTDISDISHTIRWKRILHRLPE